MDYNIFYFIISGCELNDAKEAFSNIGTDAVEDNWEKKMWCVEGGKGNCLNSFIHFVPISIEF